MLSNIFHGTANLDECRHKSTKLVLVIPCFSSSCGIFDWQLVRQLSGHFLTQVLTSWLISVILSTQT